MSNKLAAKVRAVNRANEHASRLYHQLMEVFRPLLGQPVVKNDGTVLAKIAKLLPAMPYTNSLHVFQDGSGYSLAWTVKTCEQVEGECFCVYHESTVYVGGLSGNTLKDFYQPFDGRSDYTVEGVQAAQARYREAKRLADEAKSALHPFGEYES